MFSGIPIISRKGKPHILCQCPEDESLYYDLKVQEEENGKTAVCTRCSRLAKKLPEGGQEPLLKYKVFGENKLDRDPFEVRHLPGCSPKKRISEIRESGKCDPDVSIQRSTLSGAKADVLMNTENVTDVFQLPNDGSDSIVQTAAEENESTSNNSVYPAVVVRKKSAHVYIHRLRKNNRLCYRFRKEKMGVYSYMRCLTCESVYRNKKNKVPICRKFAGSYLLKDAEGDHVPGCKPERYSEVITKYERLQEAESEQRSGFVIEKFQKKDCHILFIIPGDDAVVKCYKFLIRYNRRSLSRRRVSVFCSTCYSNVQREVRASTPGARLSRKHRRFTVDGFALDPTLNHRSDCKPLRYSHVMKQHEIVDEETAKQYLNFDRTGIENDDMNDSMPTLKRSRLSQHESDMDLTDDTVLDQSTILSEEPPADSVLMMRRINMSITVHPMKKCVTPVTGVSNSKSSSSKPTSIRKSAPVIAKKPNGIMSKTPDDVMPPQLEQQQQEPNHNRRGKRIRFLPNDADMDLNTETVNDHSVTLEDTEINGNQYDETAGMESIHHEVPVLDESGSENNTLCTIKREPEESIAEIETSVPALNLISTSSKRKFKRIKNEPVNIINEIGGDSLALRTPEKKRNSSDVRVMSAYRQYRIHSIFLDANGFSREEMSVLVDDRSVDVRFKRKTVSPFNVGVVSTLRCKHSVKFPESAQMDTLEAVLEDDEVVLTVRST